MQGWSDRCAMLSPKIGFMLTKLGQRLKLHSI